MQFSLYGFPLGFPNKGNTLTSDCINHALAKYLAAHIDNCTKEKVDYCAIYGPFDKSPIPDLHFSPFITRHKSDSEFPSVIVYLSWREDHSVKSYLKKDFYLGIFC